MSYLPDGILFPFVDSTKVLYNISGIVKVHKGV